MPEVLALIRHEWPAPLTPEPDFVECQLVSNT